MKKIIISFVLVMSILAISVYAQSTINQTKLSRSEPIKISEQQHKILSEKIKTDLDEMLQEGSISKEQHEYLTSQVERGILRGFGRGEKGRPSFVNSDGSMPDFSIDSAGCRGNKHRITHREMKE